MMRALAALVLLPSFLAAQPAPVLEARLRDGSRLRFTLAEELLPLQTPHGRLAIPAAEVRRIDLAPRLADETRKAIAAAIIDLSSKDSARREAAAEALLKIGPAAHPAVVLATRSPDRELAIFARQLRARFFDAFTEERLPTHDMDVVHTEDSKFAGRLEAATLSIRDDKFGARSLKITDLLSLREPEPERAAPAPTPRAASRADRLEQIRRGGPQRP